MAVAMEDDEAVRDASERALQVWTLSLKGEIDSAERVRRLEEIAASLTSEQAENFWKTLPAIREQAQLQVGRERRVRSEN